MYNEMQKLRAGQPYGTFPQFIGSFVAGEDLPFGRVVTAYDGDYKKVFLPHISEIDVAYDAAFITDNVISFTVNGEAIAPVTFDTDHGTTAALLVAAIEALDENIKVTVTQQSPLEITVSFRGQDIAVTSGVTGGVSQPAVTVGTAYVPSYSGNDNAAIYAGITRGYQHDSTGKNYYKAGESVSLFLDYSTCVVETMDSVTGSYLGRSVAVVGDGDIADRGKVEITSDVPVMYMPLYEVAYAENLAVVKGFRLPTFMPPSP